MIRSDVDAHSTSEEDDNDEEDEEEDDEEDDDEEEGSAYSNVDIDETYFLNTIFPLSQSLNQQSQNVDKDINRLNYALSRMEQIDHIPDLANPFESPAEGAIHAYCYGDEELASEKEIKKLHSLLEILLKMQRNSRVTLKLPPPDRIFNLQQRIKSKVPVFNPVERTAVNKQRKTHSFFMNPPSEYLKHLIATPNMVNEMSALPDYTRTRKLDLNHGEKWRHHPYFQTPMLTKDDKDFWVGDLLKDIHGSYWLVNKFLTKGEERTYENEIKKIVFAECFPVFSSELSGINDMPFLTELSTNFAVVPMKYLVPFANLVSTVKKSPNFQGNGCTVRYDNNGGFVFLHAGLNSDISRHWFGYNQYKRIIPGSPENDPKYKKVVISPVVIWSDNTSGNKSKQYNVFDSYLMYLAAMPLEKRTRRENAMFLCTSDKNLQAVDMLDAIVEDLKQLEEGIEVYSYDHNDYVLLVAPLLMLIADNPRHSQLCMDKGTSSKAPCRKCLRPKPRTLADLEFYTDSITEQRCVLHDYRRRDLSQLYEVVRCNSADVPRYKMISDKYSFLVNGSEKFLILRAFDPTQDCPVDVLHTVPLGVIKYLVDYLMKSVLTESQRDHLGNILLSCRNKDAYSRTFRKNLRHCGSFLGRDYKQLVQVLPTVFGMVFPNPTTTIRLISQAFNYLGQLTSLIYLRGVEDKYEFYLQSLRGALLNFTDALYKLDTYLKDHDPSAPVFSLKPKLHMLHHLVEDIERFGLALQYETESPEQFNKFIREHLFMTNRQYTSRDVATRFGKQFICRQLFNGLSFVYVKRWKQNNVWYEDVFRSETGCSIKAIQKENLDFKELFFGARKNETDSYYINKSIIVDGLTGLFYTENGAVLGRVEEKEDGSFELQQYTLVRCDPSFSSWFPGMKTDLRGNLYIRRNGVIPVSDSIKCKEVMDFGFIINEREDIRLVNISKFGTYWALISHNQSLNA